MHPGLVQVKGRQWVGAEKKRNKKIEGIIDMRTFFSNEKGFYGEYFLLLTEAADKDICTLLLQTAEFHQSEERECTRER